MRKWDQKRGCDRKPGGGLARFQGGQCIIFQRSPLGSEELGGVHQSLVRDGPKVQIPRHFQLSTPTEREFSSLQGGFKVLAVGESRRGPNAHRHGKGTQGVWG